MRRRARRRDWVPREGRGRAGIVVTVIVVAIGVIILWRCRVQPEEGLVWATDRVAGVHTYGFVKLTLERFQL